MTLTERELAAILAALRYWQEYSSLSERAYDPHFTEDDDETPRPGMTPFTDTDIDQLCSRLTAEQQPTSK